MKRSSRILVTLLACISAAAFLAAGASAATSAGRTYTVNISNHSSRTLVLNQGITSTRGSWLHQPARRLAPGDSTYATAVESLCAFELIIAYGTERPKYGQRAVSLNTYISETIATVVADNKEFVVKSIKRRSKGQLECDIEIKDAR